MSCAKICHYGDYNLTQRGSQTMKSIFRQNMKINKNAENIFYELFECFSGHAM